MNRMSDLLIKGMEMPDKMHTIDTCRDANGVLQANCGDGTGWHDVVEVPPHGRLIHTDAMERLMSDTVQGDIRAYPYSDTLWGMAFRWIDNQPTVLEASEDGEQDG